MIDQFYEENSDLKPSTSVGVPKAKPSAKGNNLTKVNPFKGEISSAVVCTKCKLISVNDEPFEYLTVYPLPDFGLGQSSWRRAAHPSTNQWLRA